MKEFTYYAPTEIIFGCGKATAIGEVVRRYGETALLVTDDSKPMAAIAEKVMQLLQKSGISTVHFCGVKPNPTTNIVTEGARMAKNHGAQVVIGLGGGQGNCGRSDA